MGADKGFLKQIQSSTVILHRNNKQKAEIGWDGNDLVLWVDDQFVDTITKRGLKPTNIEEWNPNKAYLAGSTYVSYQNLDIDNEVWNTSYIYRCSVDAVAGESPYTAQSKWIRQGKTGETIPQILITDVQDLRGELDALQNRHYGTTWVESWLELAQSIDLNPFYTVGVTTSKLVYKYNPDFDLLNIPEGLVYGIDYITPDINYETGAWVKILDLNSAVVPPPIDVDTLEPYSDLFEYEVNDYVSYINSTSSNPQFLSEAIYRANTSIAEGESPETNPEKWIYLGQSYQPITNATNINWVDTVNTLKGITGYDREHTVGLQSTKMVWKYDRDYDSFVGTEDVDYIIPYDQVGTGAWIPFVDLSGGNTQTITLDNVEVWSNIKIYEAGNTYVSYQNLSSTNPQFITEAIYRCIGNTLVGESPEGYPNKWLYQGTSVTISNGETGITWVESPSFLKNLTGYKEKHTVGVSSTKNIHQLWLGHDYSLDPEDGEFIIKPNDFDLGPNGEGVGPAWYLLTNLSSTSTTTTIEVEDLNPYINTAVYVKDDYVSYFNPDSLTPQFQIESIYRAKGSILANQSPESDPTLWQYLGQSITNINSIANGSWLETVSELKEVTDYSAGKILSVYETKIGYKLVTNHDYNSEDEDLINVIRPNNVYQTPDNNNIMEAWIKEYDFADHSAQRNLEADDHLQYFKNAGRAAPQTIANQQINFGTKGSFETTESKMQFSFSAVAGTVIALLNNSFFRLYHPLWVVLQTATSSISVFNGYVRLNPNGDTNPTTFNNDGSISNAWLTDKLLDGSWQETVSELKAITGYSVGQVITLFSNKFGYKLTANHNYITNPADDINIIKPNDEIADSGGFAWIKTYDFNSGYWYEDLTAWTTAETTVNLTSQLLRDFGTTPVTVQVTLTATAVTSPRLAEYAFKFVFGTGGSFILPSGVTLASDNPTLTNGITYEANIVRGKLIYKAV